MALIKLGGGIVEIRGGFGGVYFSRDTAGNHVSAQPRVVRRRTAGQNTQRNAFATARAYSTDPRTVSYNIYRALNGLPMAPPPLDYQIPTLQEPKN